MAPIIASRVSIAQYESIQKLWMSENMSFPPPIFLSESKLVYFDVPGHKEERKIIQGKVSVVCAGTSDYAVAEEAAAILEMCKSKSSLD